MRKLVLVLCILGFTSLIVGSVMAIPLIRETILRGIIIRCTGRIGGPPEESREQVNTPTQLDQIGYLTILVSIGFFATAFLYSRKSKVITQ